MKPKEYLKKYNLEAGDATFSQAELTADLAADFLAMVELQASRNFTYAHFKVIVADFRKKFDAIANKSLSFRAREQKIWNFLYASVVCPTRDRYFKEFLQQQKEAHEKRQRQYQWECSDLHEDFADYLRALFSRLESIQVPWSAFALLGLTDQSDFTIETVKIRYKQQALQHHPDRGGKHDDMLRLTEAKNKCLAYLSQASA